MVNELHRQTFREEAYEHLGELETALLELEGNPGNQELIGRTFRALHTIKGSGAMFGFSEIADFTHELETVFEQVRGGKLDIAKELIDSTLKSCDLIRAMLEGDGGVDEAEKRRLKEFFSAWARNGSADVSTGSPSPGVREAEDRARREKTYRIRFRPAREIYLTGADPVLLLDELRGLGECRVIANLDGIPALEDLNPELCYTSWDIVLTTSRGEDAVRDVFIFVEGESGLSIDVLDKATDPYGQEEQTMPDRILAEQEDCSRSEARTVLESEENFGELAQEEGPARPARIEAGPVEQQQVREARKRRQEADAAASIRVPSGKLDTLVNLVGELVTVQARLTQTAALRNDASLSLIAEEVERLTCELRDSTLNIRMMPFGSTFGKLKRLVRDLAGELGKEVELITDGAGTELDKTVIERLNDPLVHIIRNSIDHGIEPPETRETAGKPRRGTLRLEAEHSGDCVQITIRDDGAGLDGDAIRAKAVERRLIPETAELAEKELFHLIFTPGFSTAKKITGISGRGVGMDVVKQSIETLRGTIEVNSAKGEGTTIRIRLPLTLAIIESLLVRIGGERYVLPLSFVEECVALTRRDIEDAHGRDLANVRGSMVPYVPLRKRFDLSAPPPEIQQVVITSVDGERVGLLVDTVIGEHQTVIKSLGSLYRSVDGISGATILGDGTVALILDIPQLVKRG